MPTKTVDASVLLLVAGLALLPSQAVAGPPEGVSGRMVFVDRVADGLWHYREETDPGKRIEWLTKLAPSRDLRVAVVLGELQERWHAITGHDQPDPAVAAIVLLHVHYVPAGGGGNQHVSEWWEKNSDDLRRRAKRLPQ